MHWERGYFRATRQWYYVSTRVSAIYDYGHTPLSLFVLLHLKGGKVRCRCIMFNRVYALAWVKLGVMCTLNIYVLLVGGIIVVVGAVFSVDNEFFRYHGVKSCVRVC